MSIFGKLAFWKKKDDFSFDSGGDFGAGNNFGMDSGQGYGAGMNQNAGMDFGQPGQAGMDNSGFGSSDGFGPAGHGGMGDTGFDQNNQNQGFDSIRDIPGPSYSGGGLPQQAAGQQQTAGIDHKDVQIITSKLDAIKSSLDVLNQRIENLERLANDEKTKEQKRRASW